jgi:ribosome recycling factor
LSGGVPASILSCDLAGRDDTGVLLMDLDDILLEAEEQMEKTAEFFRHELRTVRTGRASVGLVDHLKVEVESYGATMTLRELANIAVAEGNTIVIKAFDPSTLKDIERAIEKSELGINPQNDGRMIRLPVPPLSTERRNQLVGHVKQLGEQQKVAIRNARRDANKALAAAEKAKELTEDDVKNGEKQVQELTDQYCGQIDKLLDEKTKEIMEV